MPYHTLALRYQIALSNSPMFHCSFSSLKDENRLKRGSVQEGKTCSVKKKCNFTEISYFTDADMNS